METRTSGTKVILGLVLAGSALAGKACVFQGDPGPQAPIPLDQPLAPGETRAGLITKESELIGGVTAKARAGDYKLYNDRSRSPSAAPGFRAATIPTAARILDVDSSARGRRRSSFGEIITAFDLSVLRADSSRCSTTDAMANPPASAPKAKRTSFRCSTRSSPRSSRRRPTTWIGRSTTCSSRARLVNRASAQEPRP